MSIHDETYHGLLRQILETGSRRTDRTGTGTIGIFGAQARYDLSQGFPLLTTKKVHTRSIVHELLWFLSGDTNIEYLTDNGVTIWDEWADENGDLGPVYGAQWRDFGGFSSLPCDMMLTRLSDDDQAWLPVSRGVDQITQVVDSLKSDPFSRRHIVSAWNPLSIEAAALPPCHTLFQFHVTPGADGLPDRLNCQLYQRSADMFLGVPFNIASYALLTHMVAAETGLTPGDFVHTLGDAHIYLNHLDQVNEQLSRPTDRPAPRLFLAPSNPITQGCSHRDIEFAGYNPYPAIKAPVSA